MRARVISAVAAGTVVLSGFASAHTVSGIDGNDVPGKFDILRTVLTHPREVILKTEVTGNLRKADFRGDNYFLWSMDTQGDEDLDYSVLLDARRRNGRLRMKCFFIRHGRIPETTGSVAGRIDGHEGSCRFGPTRIGGVPDEWNATTEYADNVDYAPNTNTYTHELGG